jgi:hypothetical protein
MIATHPVMAAPLGIAHSWSRGHVGPHQQCINRHQMGTFVREMTSEGSPYTIFRTALERGSLVGIRSAVANLPAPPPFVRRSVWPERPAARDPACGVALAANPAPSVRRVAGTLILWVPHGTLGPCLMVKRRCHRMTLCEEEVAVCTRNTQ